MTGFFGSFALDGLTILANKLVEASENLKMIDRNIEYTRTINIIFFALWFYIYHAFDFCCWNEHDVYKRWRKNNKVFIFHHEWFNLCYFWSYSSRKSLSACNDFTEIIHYKQLQAMDLHFVQMKIYVQLNVSASLHQLLLAVTFSSRIGT